MEGYIGEVRAFGGNFAPVGWLVCNGQQLAVQEYQALYSIIGLKYGGDGRPYFNLPNLKGRVPMGFGKDQWDKTWTNGQVVGVPTTTLSQKNLPAHTHALQLNNLTISGSASGDVKIKCINESGDSTTGEGKAFANINNGYIGPGDADKFLAPVAVSLPITATVSGTGAIGSTGAGAAFYQYQPTLVVNWIICVQGLYPPRQ